jgi:hypothetical protein
MEESREYTGGRFQPDARAVFEPDRRSIETTLQIVARIASSGAQSRRAGHEQGRDGRGVGAGLVGGFKPLLPLCLQDAPIIGGIHFGHGGSCRCII